MRAGIPAYALLRVVDGLVEDSDSAMRWIAAGALAAAGLYQLSPLKAVCLRHCRSPLAQLLHYGNVKGPLRDLKVAVHHAGYCLGCCWALMVLFVAFGVMNLWAMVALAAIVVGEKALARGVALGRIAGVAFLVAGGGRARLPFGRRCAPARHRLRSHDDVDDVSRAPSRPQPAGSAGSGSGSGAAGAVVGDPAGERRGQLGGAVAPVVDDDRAGQHVVQGAPFPADDDADEAEAEEQQAQREGDHPHERRARGQRPAVAPDDLHADQEHAGRSAGDGEADPAVEEGPGRSRGRRSTNPRRCRR